jgi:hypothetical protein
LNGRVLPLPPLRPPIFPSPLVAKNQTRVHPITLVFPSQDDDNDDARLCRLPLRINICVGMPFFALFALYGRVDRYGRWACVLPALGITRYLTRHFCYHRSYRISFFPSLVQPVSPNKLCTKPFMSARPLAARPSQWLRNIYHGM